MAIVFNYVLVEYPLPESVRPWIETMTHGSPFRLLIIVVVAGVVLQVINQFASMFHTQVQVDTGQRMVYDLRYKLFEHLQALGLHHHITTNTGDAWTRFETGTVYLDRKPRDERYLSARLVGDHAGGDVHGAGQDGRHGRAVVAQRRTVSVSLPPLHTSTLVMREARQGTRIEARRTLGTKCSPRCGS